MFDSKVEMQPPVLQIVKKHTTIPIILHIYDFSDTDLFWGANTVLRSVGTGVFHVAVEVLGVEYSYGYSPSGTGIFSGKPASCDEHSYRESACMGDALVCGAEAVAIISSMTHEWRGEDYDILRKNCGHFANDLCQRLGVGSLPQWITSMATASSSFLDGMAAIPQNAQLAVGFVAEKVGETDTQYMGGFMGKTIDVASTPAEVFVGSLESLDNQLALVKTVSSFPKKAQSIGSGLAAVLFCMWNAPTACSSHT